MARFKKLSNQEKKRLVKAKDKGRRDTYRGIRMFAKGNKPR